MRKKAQEKKKAVSPSSSFSSTTSSSSSSTFSRSSSSESNGNSPTVESAPITETKERNFYDTGGFDVAAARGNKTGQAEEEKSQKVVSSEDAIWTDMDFLGDDAIKPMYDYGYGEEGCNFPCQSMASPVWDYYPVSLWTMDEEESKKFPPISDQFYSFNNQEMSCATLTG